MAALDQQKKCNITTIALYVLAVIAEALAISSLVLMIIWLNKYQGGFAWKDEANFNYHPLFMLVGMIICYGNSAMAFRVIRLESLPIPEGLKVYARFIVKILHAFLHLSAFIFAVLGLVIVFNFHNNGNSPNMYSIHSWVGMGTVVLFSCQLAAGYTTFLLPFVPVTIKTIYLKVHRYFGVGILALAVVAVVSGFTEYLGWTLSNYSDFVEAGNMVNILCLLVILFVFIVACIVTNPSFQNKQDVKFQNLQEST